MRFSQSVNDDRRRRYLSGALPGDEILVTHRLMGDSELKHPVEHHPATLRSTTIEAEHELIQVSGQVGMVHCALVRAQQPSLGQGSNPMGCG